MAVNNVGSGETYTSLAAWWTAVKDSAEATEEAVLTSDLTVSQSVTAAGTNNKAVVIRSDGTRRTISVSATNPPLSIGAAIMTSVTIKDITLDAGTTGGDGLRFVAIDTSGTILIQNVITKNSTAQGFDLSTAYGTATFENCLAFGHSMNGFYLNYNTTATTTTLKNCGAYASGEGFEIRNNANLTVNMYNCWSMNNSTADFVNGVGATITADSCVCSDTSLNTGVDTADNNATGKTSYASYFTDAANGDFTLLDSDLSLWGVSGKSANSPATDIDGTSRTAYTIGPYEAAAAAAPTISSVTLTGTSQIGQTLTATVVTDQDPVDSTTYQWEKASDGSGTGAADISGETSSTLALTYADFGDLLDTAAYVRCQAIATKNSQSSTEVASDWQAVTAPSGNGVVVRIDQPVFIL